MRLMGINALALAMGCVYQSADTYASFGVNGAVMSSSDQGEHEQNMLQLNADVRDGDDAISLEQPEEGDESTDDEAEDDEEQDESEDDSQEGDESGEDLQPLPEPSEELTKASEKLTEYADGFSSLRDQAIKNGLSEALADQIEAEYEAGKGISKSSYEALEKAGYSANFVNSYIQGQEAVADQFVQSIVQYAGGNEKFQAVIKHMEAGDPGSVESLYDAMARQDLATVRTIINLGIASRTKKFGKTPDRVVQRQAPAANPAPRKGVEGYSSSAAMVADMSKPEYRLDPAFRAKVEARVNASRF